MTSGRFISAITVAVLATTGIAGCSAEEPVAFPVRIAPVPAGVGGLGPAVLAVPVADGRRGDLTGLLAVDRFGDDPAGRAPVRRHAEIAFGDPRFPTVARGLAEDPRDAVIAEGRVRDVTLPEHVAAKQATAVSAGLSITGSRCVIVPGSGPVVQPATESSCAFAERGGVYWADRRTGRFGGVDLTSGTASPGVALPAFPIAVSADGRWLASVTTGKPRRLVVADTTTGRSQDRAVVAADVTGVFTAGGFALVHDRVLSVAGAKVRTLRSEVGVVAFAPDGRRALVEDLGSGARGLVVLDLESGAVTPVTTGGAALPPVTGTVTAIATGDVALVVELAPAPDTGMPAVRPGTAWSVRLDTAAATALPGVPDASAVTVAEPPAVLSAMAMPALTFRPDGSTLSLTPDGTVTAAPHGATPGVPLGDSAVLHRLLDAGGAERADRLLIAGGAGSRIEIATGAGPDQRVGAVVPTPDGAHLLISLRPARPQPRPGEHDAVVVARRDGAGEPTVAYQGAVLVGIGP